MDIIDKLVDKYLKQYFWCEDFDKLNAVKNADSLSEEERIWYENTLRYYRDTIMTIESSVKQGYEEGREEVRKKAHAGMLEAARFMKSTGIAVEDIKKHTYGLTDEEIAAL